jgi:hypothetical protein
MQTTTIPDSLLLGCALIAAALDALGITVAASLLRKASTPDVALLRIRDACSSAHAVEAMARLYPAVAHLLTPSIQIQSACWTAEDWAIKAAYPKRETTADPWTKAARGKP